MNADESLKGHETEGCEIAGNIQEMILSQVLQGCLLRLEMTFPTDHVHFFFANGNKSESYSKAEG